MSFLIRLAVITEYQDWSFIKNRAYSLTFMDAGKFKIKGATSDVGFLAVSSHGGRWKGKREILRNPFYVASIHL